MRKFFICLAAVGFTLWFVSCEKNQSGVIDAQTDVPTLRNAMLTTNEINIDSLTASGGKYTIAETLSVRIDSRSNISSSVSVSASLFRPNETVAFLTQSLHDDGIAPDARSSDSIFTARTQFELTRAQAGRYRIQISAQNVSGLSANSVVLTLSLKRNNSKPRLFNLVAQDTAEVPTRPQDTVNVLFKVTAADSDGLADIQRVRLKPTQFTLRDDGGLGPPSGFIDPQNTIVYRRSGDSTAGDGIFSITIPVLFSSSVDTTSPRTDTYGFQAIDTFGDTSATILHNLTLRRRRP